MTDNVCKKCGDDLEGCKCGSVTVAAQDQSAIVENLRSISQQLEDTKTGLAVDLSASRQECDSLYRELSKVRDELITSKTERRVLSRWYEDVKTERDKLHGELVDVRSALAAATEERDSLRTTLEAWEQADTKPHKRVADDDVADHVVLPVVPDGFMGSALATNVEHDTACSCSAHPHPPCSHCQPLDDGNPEPDPTSDAKDASLEFRNVVPTPEMIAACQWWDLVGSEKAICFKHMDQLTVVWRSAGDHSWDRWKYEDCPQPLKPHGMTWQQLDKLLADKAQESPAAPVPAAEVPRCMTCHGCGEALERVYQNRDLPVICRNMKCNRELSPRSNHGGDEMEDPYRGPCKSSHPVRHE